MCDGGLRAISSALNGVCEPFSHYLLLFSLLQYKMNLGDKSPNEILFLNFNQDFSCVSVGTQTGYRIYNCDPFGKCYSKRMQFNLFKMTILYF
jgi:hypothetical protein